MAAFDTGTVVTLAAAPDPTSTFEGWSGDCTGTGSCVVTMSQARSVLANFKRIEYALTVPFPFNGSGTGTVTSSSLPEAIDCPVTCLASVYAGTAVTLSAVPNATSIFAGWGGACTGTGACAFIMDGPKTVTARFGTPPVADDQSASTAEDTPLGIVLTATDADNDALTYRIVTQPTQGTLSGALPDVSYSPASDFNGDDGFVFVANDGLADSAPATVTISVTAVNDPPVANNQSVTTPEDTSLSITLTATDVEDSPLTYTIIASPTGGLLSGTPPNVTYTPGSNFNGADSITFLANDGTADSNTATVSITVTAVNDPPVATGQGVTTSEDAAATIVLTATDTESPSLTYSIVTGPAGGTLGAVAGNNVVYTPAANFNGTDSFTFQANDGTVNSNAATVAITVTPINDAPTAVSDTAVVVEDSGANVIGVLANDTAAPDVGETLTITAVTQGANGTVVITGSGTALTYTPAAGFNGTDTFAYTISDGTLTDTATVTITVTGANDPPTAVNDAASVAEDSGATAIAVLANDSIAPDVAETLTITAVTQGTNSTVVITGGGTGLTYAPAANFSGADTFTYTISDGNGGTDTATVTVTVTSVNDAPTATNDAATVAEGSGATAINVLANDTFAPDTGETLIITEVTQGTNGTVVITGGGTGLTYDPTGSFNGVDTFTYTISDGNSGTDTAIVTVTVTGVNDPPTAANDAATMAEDSGATAIAVLANDSIAPDVGETLTITLVTQGTNGAVVITGGGTGLTYAPAANFFGSDTFTYTISDGTGGTDTATVTITVTGANDPPTVVNDAATVAEDSGATAITVLANDTVLPDVGETLTITAVSQGTNGTVVITGGGTGLTYAPAANFFGTDTFTYTINDGNGGADTATVTVTVSAVNDPPVTTPQGVTLDEDTSTLIVLTATDAEVDPLTYSIVTGPANGTLRPVTGNTVAYTPNDNFSGSDSVTFLANDGTADSNVSTVTITVTGVNDPVTAGDDTATVAEDSGATPINILANDSTSPDVGEPMTVILVTQGANGTVAITGGGTGLTYTPALNFSGIDTFTYTINDGNGSTDTATVTITVTAVNDPPVATPQGVTLDEDTSTAIVLTATDIEANPLTYAIVTQPTNGTLTAVDGNNVTYTPNPNYSGPDSFTFRANDGLSDSNESTVTITVTPLNDPPVANAGIDQSLAASTTVQLDGSGSNDLDGTPLTFQWTLTQTPVGSAAVLSNPTAETPTFVADLAGTYEVTLVVNDGAVDSSADFVTITAN
jgi:VCBS repeat-containing protein